MNMQTTTDAQNASTVYPETIYEEEIFYPAELEDEMGETAFHYLLNSSLLHLLRAFSLLEMM